MYFVVPVQAVPAILKKGIGFTAFRYPFNSEPELFHLFHMYIEINAGAGFQALRQ